MGKKKRKSNSKAGFIAIWTRERDREQSNMESMNTALQQQRLEVEQLRREAAMKRIPVSQAVEDIKRYAMDHMMQDHLIVGFPAKRPILSVRRLGLVTFSRNFPRIFQEIHISLSISRIESIIPIIYFSVHKLQAICILWLIYEITTKKIASWPDFAGKTQILSEKSHRAKFYEMAHFSVDSWNRPSVQRDIVERGTNYIFQLQILAAAFSFFFNFI